ncbi:MAG: site-specific integrase [Lachnospiraceae bacterium]|nr:site-specific integrase [Lachnospiraceae bacterium]
MPRKGENIYKRKDGRWEGRYIRDRTSDGKAIYGYLYAHSYRELKERMAHEEKAPKPVCRTPDVLFEEVAKEWLLYITPRVKESTCVKYSNLLNSYIIPVLGNQSILSLSSNKIDTFCQHLLTKGGRNGTGLSSKTVSDCLARIRSIMRYASDKLELSLCDAKSVTVKQQQKEMRSFTVSEQKTLLRYLYDNLNESSLGILICLFTGLRIGEICALKWSEISIPEKTLHVRFTMQRIQILDGTDQKTKILISEPKSACSIRTIPLLDELTELLEKYKCSDTAYILSGREDQYVEPRTMQYRFKKVMQECGITNASYHTLRHTFATRCVEQDFDIKTLSEILGHANVNITLNKYVHPSMELKRKNMMRLSELIAVK